MATEMITRYPMDGYAPRMAWDADGHYVRLCGKLDAIEERLSRIERMIQQNLRAPTE